MIPSRFLTTLNATFCLTIMAFTGFSQTSGIATDDLSSLDPVAKSSILAPQEPASYVLDSIIIKDDNKVIYNYNERGENTTQTTFVWCVDSEEWLNAFRSQFTYDQNHNTTLKSTAIYAEEKWINTDSTLYKYDERNNQLLAEKYSFDPATLVKTGDYFTLSTYDDLDNLTERIYHNWDANKEKWIPRLKTTTTYDKNNSISVSYRYDSELSIWNLTGKSELIYDDQDQLITSISYGYAEDQWVGFHKLKIYYDQQNRETGYSEWSWDETTSDWIGKIKREYVFNNNDKRISDESYKWSTSTNNWTGDFKDEYIYNSENDLIEKTSFSGWDNAFNWIPTRNSVRENFVLGVAGLETEYLWNINTKSWDLSKKIVSDLDEQGRVLSSNSYFWSNSIWTSFASTKSETSYSSNGDTTVLYEKNDDTWQLTSRHILSLSPDSIETRINQIWDVSILQWINSSKTIHDLKLKFKTVEPEPTAESEPFPLDYERYLWDTSSNQWIGTEKVVFRDQYQYEWIYHSLANCTPNSPTDIPPVFFRQLPMSEEYSWDSTAGDWRVTYGRNIMKEFDEFDNVTLQEQLEWNEKTLSYEVTKEFRYYYRKNLLELFEENTKTRLVVHPNPTVNYLSFSTENDLSNVKIFTANGILVSSYDEIENQTINVSNLEAGFYFIQAVGTEKNYTSQFLKR